MFFSCWWYSQLKNKFQNYSEYAQGESQKAKLGGKKKAKLDDDGKELKYKLRN